MLQVQMLTSEPVRAGTTFRVIFGRGVGEAVIEDTKVDRPHSWTAVSRSRVLDVESEGQILDVPGGSRLIMRSRLRPAGPSAYSPRHWAGGCTAPGDKHRA